MSHAPDSIVLLPGPHGESVGSALRTFIRRAWSTWRSHSPELDSDGVRQLCMGMLADVPSGNRGALVLRLSTLRRADDVQHLRGALFDVISHFHGEATARERIGALDRSLRLPRAPAPGPHGPGRMQERRSRKP